MSQTRSLTISPRHGGTNHADVHVLSPNGARMCIGAYTGDASVHLHPTDDEARELIAALQWALDQRAAVDVAA